jgi:hypothetical protein
MKRLLMLAAAGLFITGCASPNVNPQQARANTGYVDFHAEPPGELSWQVARFDDGKGAFQSVFMDLNPPQDGFVRLAFAPGRYRLRVTFVNRVIVKPAEVEVEVQDGKITPVRVTLTGAGVALVRTREENVGGVGHRRYGQHAKIGNDEADRYDIAAAAAPPVAYQPKQRMPYAR